MTVGQIRILKTSVPYVAKVENRRPAVGGADAETIDDAKARAPVLLRTRGRAVTAEDFCELARDVAPDAARVHCHVVADGPDAGGVRVLVVPHVVADRLGRVRLEDLKPPEATVARIGAHLDERRLVGTRLAVSAPEYVGVTVIVQTTATPGVPASTLEEQLLRALYGYLDPLRGGRDGTGWAFGHPVEPAEIVAAIAHVQGVDRTQPTTVRLFAADLGTGRRAPADRVDVPPHALPFSFDHQVQVRR